MNICRDCEHFIQRGDIWYDMFCGCPNVEKKTGVDPVTGKTIYISKNDLGRSVGDSQKRPYARDINDDGRRCRHYQRRKLLLSTKAKKAGE